MCDTHIRLCMVNKHPGCCCVPNRCMTRERNRLTLHVILIWFWFWAFCFQLPTSCRWWGKLIFRSMKASFIRFISPNRLNWLFCQSFSLQKWLDLHFSPVLGGFPERSWKTQPRSGRLRRRMWRPGSVRQLEDCWMPPLATWWRCCYASSFGPKKVGWRGAGIIKWHPFWGGIKVDANLW